MVETANTIWRDFVIDGMPASGPNPPAKGLVREWGTWVEEQLDVAVLSGVAPVADRTGLAALSVDASAAFLLEAGRAGFFRKVEIATLSAELQTAAAADNAARQGVFVVSSVDATFAWMRADFERWTLKARWFGVVVDSGSAASDNVVALDAMIALMPSRGVIELDLGLVNIDSPINCGTKEVSWQGCDKLASGLYAVGYSNDSAILEYPGATGDRIQDIFIRRMALWSDTGFGRVCTLTWVNKSTFEDLYFYGINRGFVCDYSWSNSYKNISCQGITTETFYFFDECNNVHFDRVEFRGSSGFRVIGNTAGLTFSECDIEGIVGTDSSGLLLAPATGKTVRDIKVLSYFENIEGAAIRCAGVDADSVRGLFVRGYFYGGNVDYFASSATKATHAIVLTNVIGIDIKVAVMEDWRYGIFVDSTAKYGEVKHCPESRLSQGFQQGTAGTGLTITRAA